MKEVRINSIVLGSLGEVGRSVQEILNRKYKVLGVDVGFNQFDIKCDYLNICIPYSKHFINIVHEYIKRYEPKLTIIHSTVPVGTSFKLGAVHSPVQGVHPRLTLGLDTYKKYVGFDCRKQERLARAYLGKVFKIKMVKGSDTTELMKCLCLVRYGLHLEIADEMKNACGFFNKDYNKVVKEWDADYNEGNKKIRKEVCRPLYYPPNGKIGGHCCVSVTRMFSKQYSSGNIERFLKKYDH